MDRTAFDLYTETLLAPTLEPGDVVILDNLAVHKSQRAASARTFAKHLKALRWRTPYQLICEAWTKDPSIFKINPHHLIPGPHT